MLPVSHADPQRAVAGTAMPAAPDRSTGASAFARVIPRNQFAAPCVPAPVAVPPASTGTSDLLASLRHRCATDGAPATITRCLRDAAAMQPVHRAVLLQRLSLALADDRRPGSPVNVLCDARSDAVLSYLLQEPEVPPAYETYHASLAALYMVVSESGGALPGVYGFLQQSTACAAVLATARTANAIRQALSGWLQWQWSAVAAFERDPLMRSQPGDLRMAAVHNGYALNEPTAINAAVLAALEPPVASAATTPSASAAQRDQ